MTDWIRRTKETIRDEVLGEDVEHPVVRRILAYIVDYLVFAVFGGIVTFVLYQFDAYTYERLLFIWLPSTAIYFTLGSIKRTSGQTLGKRLFGIQVVDEKGDHVTFLTGFLRGILVTLLTSYMSIFLVLQRDYEVTRTTLSIVRSLFVCLVIGVFYFGATKLNRQGLHDLLFSTQVTERRASTKTEKGLTPKLVIGYLLVTIVLLVTIWDD